MKKRLMKKRLLSMVLGLCIGGTLLSSAVVAAETTPQTIISICALEKREYILPVGADQATIHTTLTFPETIMVDVECAATEEMTDSHIMDSDKEDEVDIGTGKPQIASGSNTIEGDKIASGSNTTEKDNKIIKQVDLSVIWESDREFSTEQADKFTYTAKLLDTDRSRYVFAEGVNLPAITVTVAESTAKGRKVEMSIPQVITGIDYNLNTLNSGNSIWKSIKLDKIKIESIDGKEVSFGELKESGYSIQATIKTAPTNPHIQVFRLRDAFGEKEQIVTKKFTEFAKKDSIAMYLEYEIKKELNAADFAEIDFNNPINLKVENQYYNGSDGILIGDGKIVNFLYKAYDYDHIIDYNPIITFTNWSDGVDEPENNGTKDASIALKKDGDSVCASLDFGNNQILTCRFFYGDIKNDVVEIGPGAPETSVNGLSDLLDTTNIGTLLTEAEMDAVEYGGSVELKFSADVKTDSEAAADKSAIEAIATGKKVGMLLDFSVKKTVMTSRDIAISMDEEITTLAKNIEVEMLIPSHIQGKAGLCIYRVHNGVAEELAKDMPDANGEYYTISPDGTVLTLYVKNFSTYALAYTAYDVNIADGGTGSSGNGRYAPGDTVTIDAGSKSNYRFRRWTATNGTVALANVNSPNTTFIMPNENVTITANWSHSNNNDDSSSSQDIRNSLPPNYKGGTKIIGNVRVPDYTVEGSWKKNENGIWNFTDNEGDAYKNTWVPIFNPYADLTKGQNAFDWFRFDADGIMLTGWYTDSDGSIYYLNPNSDGTLGAMNVGWVLIDGKYYYFNENPDGTRGRMLKNTTTPDGYYVDENGVWKGNTKQ